MPSNSLHCKNSKIRGFRFANNDKASTFEQGANYSVGLKFLSWLTSLVVLLAAVRIGSLQKNCRATGDIAVAASARAGSMPECHCEKSATKRSCLSPEELLPARSLTVPAPPLLALTLLLSPRHLEIRRNPPPPALPPVRLSCPTARPLAQKRLQARFPGRSAAFCSFL